MASVNKVILVGNLGRDPEIRTFPSGDQVANVTIATSDRWKDKQSGEMREHTEWHRLVFNGRLAEIAGQYLRKGSQIYVEGSIRTRKWAARAMTKATVVATALPAAHRHNARQPPSVLRQLLHRLRSRRPTAVVSATWTTTFRSDPLRQRSHWLSRKHQARLVRAFTCVHTLVTVLRGFPPRNRMSRR